LRDNATFGRISRNISRRNRVNFFISIMLVTVLTVSLNIYPIMAQTVRIHERPELGLRFPYPSDWSVEDDSLIVTLTAPDMSSTIRFTVGIQNQDEGNSGVDSRDLAHNLLEIEEPGYQILNEGWTSINGRDLYSILIIPENQDERELYMVTGLIEATVYIFRLYSNSEQTYSQTLPTFQAMITSAELTGANPDLLEEGVGGGVQQGEEFNPFGQGGASPGGGGGVQQGQGQTPDDGGFGSQSQNGGQTQEYRVPVLMNVIGPTNLNSNGNACITVVDSVTGEQQDQLCNDFELDANRRSSGQFQLQDSLTITNIDEEELIQFNVEVCITLTSSNAQPIEKCNTAVYDRNQAAYIANIDFTVGGQSGQVQQGPGFGENSPPSGQGQPSIDFINQNR
jgi:hypothetical protein